MLQATNDDPRMYAQFISEGAHGCSGVVGFGAAYEPLKRVGRDKPIACKTISVALAWSFAVGRLGFLTSQLAVEILKTLSVPLANMRQLMHQREPETVNAIISKGQADNG